MAETRIQLCGRLVARIDGARIEEALPGRQGRLAFVYLAANRHRPVTRAELDDALWRESGGSDRLSPLVSKLRQVVPLEGRGEVRLALVYEALRLRLRDELGAAPSPSTQAVHRRLLG